jgi:hypothetical protein
MQEDNEMRDSLAVHIRAAGRPLTESDRFAQGLVDYSWPSGTHDRNEPIARGWLRMWGPNKLIVDVPRCGCAEGRCAICN